MAPLPDRYGDEVKKQNSDEEAIVSDNFLTTIAMVAGACGIALMAESLILKQGAVYNFSTFALTATKQQQYIQYCVYGCMVTGLTTFVTGCIGGWVSLHNYRRAMKLFLLLLLLWAVIQLAAGIGILVFLGIINDAIYKSDGASTDNGGFKDQITDFQLAMFNECCASAGYTDPKEGVVTYCNGQITNSDPQDITTCYRNEQTYYQYHTLVVANKDYVCGLLKKGRFDVTGVKIPGTSVDVTFVTKKITVLPIVGNHTFPIFGCGAGYGKAFQAAQFLWVDQNAKPLATTAVITAVVEILCLAIGFGALYFGSAVKSENAATAYERYVMELQQQTHPRTQDAFEYQNNVNRMSMGSQMSQHSQGSYPMAGMPQQFNGRPGQRLSVTTRPHMAMAELPVAHAIPASFNVDDKI